MQILSHMKCVLGRTHLVLILFSPQLSISFPWDQPFSNIRMDLTHCLFHWGKFCHHRLLEVALVVMSGRAQQKSHIEASLYRWDGIRRDNHSLGPPHLNITEITVELWPCAELFSISRKKKRPPGDWNARFLLCFDLSNEPYKFLERKSSKHACESTSSLRRGSSTYVLFESRSWVVTHLRLRVLALLHVIGLAR